MRVVIDTNVWVSALLTPRGHPARVVEAFRVNRKRTSTSGNTIRVIAPPHTRDNFLLETAIWGRAQYLVTRDDDLKRDAELIEAMQSVGVGILSVKQFLELLKTQQ